MSLLAGATVAFDLDGTLVDSAPDLVKALNQVLGEQGLTPLAYEKARSMVGLFCQPQMREWRYSKPR